jgi:parallel beta-helix repeat protein
MPSQFSLALGALAALTASAAAGALSPSSSPEATPGPEPRIAVNAVNTPGDADSVFHIAAPGSYYLAANVSGESSKYGIEIEASGVTLDLMGFNLVGVPGSFIGVYVSGTQTDIAIHSGSVRGWDSSGVNTLSATRVTLSDLTASDNGTTGLIVGGSSVVERCVADNNTVNGIDALSGDARIVDCVANGNVDIGINSAGRSSISGCVANSNQSGIVSGQATLITNCVAALNTFDGFNLTDGGGIISGCTAMSNTEHGMILTGNNTARGNTCFFNGTVATTGAGIRVNGTGSVVDNNLLVANRLGLSVLGSRVIITRNRCRNNGVLNYDIAANNYYGEIVDRVNVATPLAGGNSAASTLTSTDPNANFAY